MSSLFLQHRHLKTDTFEWIPRIGSQPPEKSSRNPQTPPYFISFFSYSDLQTRISGWSCFFFFTGVMESRIAQRNRQIRWWFEIRGKMNGRPKCPTNALNTYRIDRILRSFCSWLDVYMCVYAMKLKEVGRSRSAVVAPGREWLTRHNRIREKCDRRIAPNVLRHGKCVFRIPIYFTWRSKHAPPRKFVLFTSCLLPIHLDLHCQIHVNE